MKMKKADGGIALVVSKWTVRCSIKDYAAHWDNVCLSEKDAEKQDLQVFRVKQVMGVLSKHCNDCRYVVDLVRFERS